VWRIGDANDPKGTVVITNPNPTDVQPDAIGFFTVTDVSPEATFAT
jgi:hypothetical protein